MLASVWLEFLAMLFIPAMGCRIGSRHCADSKTNRVRHRMSEGSKIGGQD